MGRDSSRKFRRIFLVNIEAAKSSNLRFADMERLFIAVEDGMLLTSYFIVNSVKVYNDIVNIASGGNHLLSRKLVAFRGLSAQGLTMELVKDAFHNNNEVDWLKFPYQIRDVDDGTNKQLLSDFTGERTGFVQVGPKKWFFPSGYRENAEFYYNFQPRPTDVWIVTFPRSGTTWTQELVWLLANDLNYEKASQTPLEARFPFLEFSSFVHPAVKEEFLAENENSKERCSAIQEVTSPVWKMLAQTTEKRFIKSHLPFELLPPNLLEVIYVARNPKDVAVSYYHLNRLFRTQGYLRDFPRYWHYFKNDLQPWTPYWAHIQQGWDRRHSNNFFFMFYEDMIKDLQKCLLEVSDFLGVSYSNEEYEVLLEHLKIDNFKNNNSVNWESMRNLGIMKSSEEGFVRRGKSGNWKDYFRGDLNEEADKWIEDNLKKTDIRFPIL